jgi:hypothetical protein
MELEIKDEINLITEEEETENIFQEENKNGDNNKSQVDEVKPTPITCWICFGTENLFKKDVCYCKGDDSFVHIECLLKWINTSGKKNCCKCNYQYELASEYTLKILEYFHPFFFIVLIFLCLLVFVHMIVIYSLQVEVVSMQSFRLFIIELDLLAMAFLSIAFSYVYLKSEEEDIENDKLFEILSTMFEQNLHFSGMEMFMLYGMEGSICFVSLRILYLLCDAFALYIENVININFKKNTILSRTT